MLRGETDVARRCYSEACLIDPGGIDWAHMKDGALAELRDQLKEMNPILFARYLKLIEGRNRGAGQ